jgi:ketosteroid isomerase-like protein
MDRETVAQWLERYVDAWRSYDPQTIGDLFSEDATYKYQPWGDPVMGREAIVANWLESPDAPDSWSAQYEPYAVDGDRAVTVGWTNYFGEDRRAVERAYYNVWLMRFDQDGRCKEFIEVYMEAPTKQGSRQ